MKLLKPFQNQSFDELMAIDGEKFRDLPARQTKRFQKNGQFYFIKQHFGVGWKEIFKNIFQGRLLVISARNEYLAIQRCQQLGIPTMECVALGERYWNPARRQSFIITRELKNIQGLDVVCKNWKTDPPSFAFKKKIIKAVAEISRKLHENGMNHRDYYLCHLALKNSDLPIYLMDLHRVQIRARVPQRWRIKDIAGLYFSAMDMGLTKKDICRFLKIYFNKPLKAILKHHRNFLVKVSEKAIRLYNKEHNKTQLNAIQHNASNNFKLILSNSEFISEKILRIIPGKRIVASGYWRNKKVVVKIFLKGCVNRYIQEEIQHVNWFNRIGIPMSSVLFYGKTNISGINVVIFEYVESLIDVDHVWCGEDEKALESFLKTIQMMMVKLHEVGCFHADLHPHNFLIARDGILLTDLSAIKQQKLNEDKIINNLSILYAQLYLRHQALILKMFKQYCDLRNWVYSKKLETKMLKALFKARRKRIVETKKHYTRQGTWVVKTMTCHYRILCMRSEDNQEVRKLLSSPDDFINEKTLIKRGNSCTLAKVKINEKYFIIKRYNIKNFRHRLRRLFRKSRALRSWENTHILRLFGIQTVKPIAIIEQGCTFCPGVSYFVYEYVEGECLKKFYERIDVSREDQKCIARHIITILKELALVLITRGDMKSTNFILQNGWPIMIDLDAARFHRNERTFKKYYREDVNRLLNNFNALPHIKTIFEELI